MESLFYLFKLPIALLAISLVTLLVVLIVPSRVIKKKWSFGLFLVQVVVAVIVTWFHIQPKEYPKTYEGKYGELLNLSELADLRDFYIGAAVENEPEMLEYAKNHFNSITPDNALKWAHEVDPEVELFLNEQFDQYDSEKAESFLKYVEELVVKDIPIDGVGIQAHAMFTVPRIEPFRKFLKAISDLGLKIEVTELDARLRLFGSHDDPY